MSTHCRKIQHSLQLSKTCICSTTLRNHFRYEQVCTYIGLFASNNLVWTEESQKGKKNPDVIPYNSKVFVSRGLQARGVKFLPLHKRRILLLIAALGCSSQEKAATVRRRRLVRRKRHSRKSSILSNRDSGRTISLL